MILGRRTNLWLGLATAIQGAITITLIAVGFDPAVVGTLSGAWGAVVGAIVLLVANGTPFANEGETVKVVTPDGQPNREITA